MDFNVRRATKDSDESLVFFALGFGNSEQGCGKVEINAVVFDHVRKG